MAIYFYYLPTVSFTNRPERIRSKMAVGRYTSMDVRRPIIVCTDAHLWHQTRAV